MKPAKTSSATTAGWFVSRCYSLWSPRVKHSTLLTTLPRVHKTAANVGSAFQTHLHQFTAKRRTFQAHVADAHLRREAGQYAASVSGLKTCGYLQAFLVRRTAILPFSPTPTPSLN